MSWLSAIAARFARAFGPAKSPPPDNATLEFVRSLDEVVTSLPSNQNMIDVIPGWNHALPPRAGVNAGALALYDDARIQWAVQQFGSIKDRTVLELGPLEAAHTCTLELYEPAKIDAIEANCLAYLRCLIVKEILGMQRSHFYLGNFVKWLEQHDETYDLIIASGVLYHMLEPTRFLELLARRCNAVYIWTHYFSEEAMPPGDDRRLAFLQESRVVAYRGAKMHLHARSYHQAQKNTMFCGGPTDMHYWMERPDLLRMLGMLGFNDVRIAHDQPDHPNGPALSVFARRTA